MKEQASLTEDVRSARFICVDSTEPIVSSIILTFLQLCTVRGLLQQTVPKLLQLNEKAAFALRERDECMSARDQAVEDREQVRGHPGPVLL